MTLNQQNSSNSFTFFTIGHSNVPADKIVTLLKDYHVEVVVDILSSPFSRFSPQFNRERFSQTLAELGIEYKYAGDLLGGRPKEPSSSKDGVLPKGKVDFMRVIDYPAIMKKESFKEGIRLLVDIASRQTIAIMCSETDPPMYHRHHMVGSYLKQQEHNVLHILKDGSIIEDQALPILQDGLTDR